MLSSISLERRQERQQAGSSRSWRPSRSRGQCFLRDEHTIERIIDAIAPESGETLIEIGGGHGELTHALARRGARVVTIESDSRLTPSLGGEGIEVIEQDALTVDLEKLLDERDLGVVRLCGNLPYSMAAPILLKVLSVGHRFQELTLMFQDEVAARLVARPSTKAYGFLSVVAQQAARVRVLFRIPREAFRPRPRVVSALVRLELRHEGAPEIGDERTFRTLVHSLFAHRRKTLANNVRQLHGSSLSRQLILAAMDRLGIDPRRRAETLSVEDFAAISRIIISSPA
ncbi:MAG TPA: 16S rRNA (adenine(1518)-N(6)/adenine(1519)-N(6))-dimethyltransferase RsmA [Vicinamibacteria bacterium]|nr:16S rRNA (adenine(1518)-N(6)/adenine(1519)-N(6))-dimethyltransferase RsmA [Vicinamibacteria bacterium]